MTFKKNVSVCSTVFLANVVLAYSPPNKYSLNKFPLSIYNSTPINLTIVGMEIKDKSFDRDTYTVAGVAITPDGVLTAAQNLFDRSGRLIAPKNITFYNVYDKSSYNIRYKVFIPKDYDSLRPNSIKSIKNNLAFIKLESEVFRGVNIKDLKIDITGETNYSMYLSYNALINASATGFVVYGFGYDYTTPEQRVDISSLHFACQFFKKSKRMEVTRNNTLISEGNESTRPYYCPFNQPMISNNKDLGSPLFIAKDKYAYSFELAGILTGSNPNRWTLLLDNSGWEEIASLAVGG